MEYQFKTGDRVRVKKPNIDWPETVGELGTVVEGPVGSKFLWKVKLDIELPEGREVWCDAEPISITPASKPSATKFIVTFDDGNEGFTSEKALRARIAELVKEPVAGRTFTATTSSASALSN
jgi:hypothetical protein